MNVNVVSGHMQLSDPPPFQSFWLETKGGGHSVGINWTFSNPTFSLSLSKDLVRKSSAKDPQKKFRRFAAIFTPKTL